MPVRMLDGLHLATAMFLAGQRMRAEIATYDGRMARAARVLALEVVEP